MVSNEDYFLESISMLFYFQEGWTYASFIYQMSFATTTSAIVSGNHSVLLEHFSYQQESLFILTIYLRTSAGMAERVRLKAYIIISFIMTLIHSIPAHWVWSDNGILFKMGVIDSAGCSVVSKFFWISCEMAYSLSHDL